MEDINKSTGLQMIPVVFEAFHGINIGLRNAEGAGKQRIGIMRVDHLYDVEFAVHALKSTSALISKQSHLRQVKDISRKGGIFLFKQVADDGIHLDGHDHFEAVGQSA